MDHSTEKSGPPAWQLAIIAFLLLGGAVALMQWAQTLSSERMVIGSPGMFPYQGPITSVREIAGESAKANLLAKDVVLADVKIDEVIGERVFLISEQGQNVPVVMFGELTDRQHDRAVALEAGQRIRIYGVIRMLRSIEEIVDEAALAADDAQKLRDHETYISAFRVVPLPIRERVQIPRIITAVSQFEQVSDPEALQAREVVLDEVKVLEVLGDHTFLVGDEGASVPVALLGEMTGRQHDRAVTLEAGQRIRIYGVIRMLRSIGEIVDQEALAADDAQKLRDHETYISASRVVPLPIRERVQIPRIITAVSQFEQVSDPEALQAREVVLDEVKVLEVLGDHTFLVGDEGASVPVALLGEMTQRQAEGVTQLRVGQVVRIYGVIRLLRSQQEIEDMLMVSPEVAAQLRGNAVYVSALRVVLLEASL